MKTHAITMLSLIVLAFSAIATTGCSGNAGPEQSSSTGEELANTGGGGGGLGYSCTDGVCQCRGIDDCDSMFPICKQNLYCNYDTIGGLRCICWDFVLRTGAPGVPSVGVGGGVFK